MEAATRKLKKMWGGCGCGCRRGQHDEEEYYDYYDYDDDDMYSEHKKKSRVIPLRFFPVCVGPEKQKFMITIEHAIHPRFSALFEEDEEYDRSVHYDGPLWLPSTDLDVFRQALAEIEASLEENLRLHPAPAPAPAPPVQHRWGRRLSKILRALKFFKINHRS